MWMTLLGGKDVGSLGEEMDRLLMEEEGSQAHKGVPGGGSATRGKLGERKVIPGDGWA